MSSILLACIYREESTMQGAAIVLRTLVPNARRIFSIIAEQQIQDPDQGEPPCQQGWGLASFESGS